MLINHFFYLRLIIFSIIIVILQIALIVMTNKYFDLLAILLIILIINQECKYTYIAIISIVADLLGYWYLGTHLFAITILTMFTGKLLNFYQVSHSIQKLIIIILCLIFTKLIILTINLVTHNAIGSIIISAYEIIAFCPLIFIIYQCLNIQHEY